MKKLIITSVTILAFTMTFTGCNGSDETSSGVNSSSNDKVSNNTPDNTTKVNGKKVAKNEYGISSDLGTPPQRPE